MIRVGFILEFADNGWLGGASYYRNLFSAVRDLPGRRIDPVLVTSGRRFGALKTQFPDLSIVRLPLLDAPSLVGKARRVMRVLSGRDVLMERALRSENIEILSHSGYFGKGSPLASIAWIPDFQELTFPEFFSRRELASRRRNAVRCSRHASTVLLSSESALADLGRMGIGADTAVLPFVATVPSAHESLTREQLRTKYGLVGKFLHLPNQFWLHKNHIVILRALALLREQGKTLQVVATGNAIDPRQPDHFSSLMETARQLGVDDDLFRPLGVVPYQDLMSLMRHALAVINPSKFEGWSTTVEEAKSMGKTVLLSDIAVHREQAPARAAFFPPDDAGLLAAKMSDVWDRWDAGADAQFVDRAAVNLAARREAFARRYEEIVLSTLSRHGTALNRAAASARCNPLNR